MSDTGLLISALFLLASYFNEKQEKKLIFFGLLFLITHLSKAYFQ